MGGRGDVGLTTEMGSCKAKKNPEEDLEGVLGWRGHSPWHKEGWF